MRASRSPFQGLDERSSASAPVGSRHRTGPLVPAAVGGGKNEGGGTPDAHGVGLTLEDLKQGPAPLLEQKVPRGPAGGSAEPRKPPYWLITSLATIGVVETAYLLYEKLFGGPVGCPMGGNCNDVLNSEYGTLLGLPLPLYGLLSYSAVAILSQVSRINSNSKIGRDYSRWLLLGTTSIMAAASGYFMYILNFQMENVSCTYCVVSALLSGSLLLATLTGFTEGELQKGALTQLGLGATVVVALSLAFSDASSMDLDLPPIEPEVTTTSGPVQLALAKHLKSIGAKMYGAFWCSHCFEQKQMFGQDATRSMNYVECYPDGYRRGVKIAEECDKANVQGFPTWIIDGKPQAGELSLEELANLSRFDISKIGK
eukprot:SM000005S17178  [mRNA]  locus=s5:587544:590129:+ [translate_table: standard]